MEVENEKMMQENKGEVVLYQPDESIKLEVMFEEETVWLTQMQMAELFRTTKQNVSSHVSNIFAEGELDRQSTVKDYLTVQLEGVRTVERKIQYFNLDVIISVGYRVKSQVGTRFRQWANNVIKQHLLHGYSINRQLIALQERTDERFQGIQQQLDEQKEQVSFLVDMHRQPSEILFATGCVWDAWVYLSELVRTAKQNIILIDNYVDERTLLLLDKRRKGVTCTVHTRFNQQNEIDFTKHNKQTTPIEKVQLPHQIHDRYLIVDDAVWLLGASVKDMGHSLCTIIKVSFTPDEIMSKLK